MRKTSYLAFVAVVLAGCGGSSGGPTSGDGSQDLIVGPVITNVSGAIQQPIITSGSNLVVMGVYGGNVSGMTVKMPPMSQLTAQQVANQTLIGFTKSGRPQIYEVGTGDIFAVGNNISSIASDSYTDISPDGTKVLSTEAITGVTPSYQIFVTNLDGSNRVQLTSGPTTNAIAKWSPDGTKICFTQYSADFLKSKIAVMKPDGSAVQSLTSGNNDIYPTWAFDGSKILFTRGFGNNADRELWTVNANGTQKQKVSVDGRSYSLAEFSPLGDEIIASYSEGGVSHLGRFLPGQTPNSIFTAPEFESVDAPTWSPDGANIACDYSTPNQHQLAIVPSNGAGEADLRFTQTASVFPSWGPFLNEKKLIGASTPFGASAGGFLFGLQGKLVPSVVAFDSTVRNSVTVSKQTDTQPDQPDVVVTIQAPDKLNSLQYINSLNAPPTKVILPGTASTHAAGAAVAFDAETGHIAAIITYQSSANIMRRNGKFTVDGPIQGIWDADGKNLAPNGAKEVVIDSVHGTLLSHR